MCRTLRQAGCGPVPGSKQRPCRRPSRYDALQRAAGRASAAGDPRMAAAARLWAFHEDPPRLAARCVPSMAAALAALFALGLAARLLVVALVHLNISQHLRAQWALRR